MAYSVAMPDSADLFRPSVQHPATALPPKGRRPWRPSSTAVVGFFGGPFAATWYALDNLTRLDALGGPEARRVKWIGYTAFVAMTAVQLAAVLLLETYDRETMRWVRMGNRLLGYGVGYALAAAQSGPLRRWLQRNVVEEDALDSAFWPGLSRVFGYGMLGAVPVLVALAWRLL